MSLDGVETPDVASEFRRLRLRGAVAALGGILLAAAIAAVLALAADGGEPNPKRILYPAFAMFFLVAAVLQIHRASRLRKACRAEDRHRLGGLLYERCCAENTQPFW
jgi:hypothetical protein